MGPILSVFPSISEVVADADHVQSATSAGSTGAATHLGHSGRQPLYDWTGAVAGYELLFRGAATDMEASRRSAYAIQSSRAWS